jgi:hypothetical protein
MSKGSLNLRPAIWEWWSTDGLARPVPYIAVPVAVGVATYFLDIRFTNAAALQAGVILLTAVLFDTLFHAYGWAEDAAAVLGQSDAPRSISGGWEYTRQMRRLKAVGRLYRTLAWATLVALGMTVTLVAMSTSLGPDSPLPAVPEAWRSTFLAVLGTHLVMVLLTAVNRVFIVTGSTIRKHESDARKRAA